MTDIDPARRSILTVGLMIAVFMASLDGTIVSVVLPQMQGNLSASPEQITWVLTSFIVIQSMMMPISGWLSGRFGSKTMILTCTALFSGVSVLCGIAPALPEMVGFRLLQGVMAAPIGPIAQAVLLNINPPERFGRAMALFTMAAVAGPIIGPVLGGYIADQWTWRWCFYINVPAGLVAFLLVATFLPSLPRQPRRFDFLGFGSLAIAIAAAQLVLDRGPIRDWFASPEIWTEAVICACALWVYIAHTVTAKDPLFHPDLARDRNFVAAGLITMVFSTILFGSLALLPLLTQTVLGYPVLLSGLVGVPRGVVVVAILQVMGRLDVLFDRRMLIGFGLFALAASFWLMGDFNLEIAASAIVVASIVQGVGHGFVSAPLTTTALATLRPELRADGSAINNLLRSLGGSLGISAIQGLTVFNVQRMHEALAAHVRMDNPVVRSGLGAALSPTTTQGAMRLNEEINRQAMMVAYVDDFRILAALTLVAAPLLLLLRDPRRHATPLPTRATPPLHQSVEI